jgi:membrane protease YdiL (CAAX protease family)
MLGMGKLKEFVRRHQLIAFSVLAYTITWAVWIPSRSLQYVGLISAWGAFGPALAGIIITRLVNPKQSDRGRKVPLSALLLGVVVSTLVFLLMVWMQVRPPWPPRLLFSLLLQGFISAIAPAFVLASAFSRNEAIGDFLKSLVKPRGSAINYLFALFLFPLTFWLGNVISRAFGLAPFYVVAPRHGWDAVLFIMAAFISKFFYGNGLGEEPGWRGFVLPRLQTRYSPIVSSLIIALVWFPWHLPLTGFGADEISYLGYGLGFIPEAVVLTWLFNRSNGSILAVGIAHTAYNVSGMYLFPPSYAVLIIQFILVGGLLFVDRMWDRNTLRDSSAVYAVAEQQPEND